MEKETMKKEDLAISLKHQGYNCCQAILCAFQEETGLSEEALRKNRRRIRSRNGQYGSKLRSIMRS